MVSLMNTITVLCNTCCLEDYVYLQFAQCGIGHSAIFACLRQGEPQVLLGTACVAFGSQSDDRALAVEVILPCRWPGISGPKSGLDLGNEAGKFAS